MEMQRYISMRQLSRELGLPLAWVKSEAEAGRIPFLPVGKRKMFDSGAVRLALRERATQAEAVIHA